MPFRSDDHAPTGVYVPADPLARFAEIHAALDSERKWHGDKIPLRLAAVCLITTPGEPAQLASATRRRDADLRSGLGWLSNVTGAVRMLIAAQMVKHDDDPVTFIDEVERVRALMRAAKVRRDAVYETLAVLVLRRVLGQQRIEAAHIERFHAIYEAMKRHHWFLTGPEDYPACAMLLARSEDPQAIGDGTDAIYKALHDRADLWRGDALQTAANVLYLSGVEPVAIADRFAALMNGFRAGGARIGQDQYDELAILCFLAWPVERIVQAVLEFRTQLLETQKWIGKDGALNLAASLAFIRIAGQDSALGPLADAKLLLDMQAIVAARQAAAVVAAS
ncbi:MAG TPA: DUF4003 family protein [Nannocystis sp.]|jgi:hypothetical protein